ncbi:MAG: 3-dehydroquinate synthase [Bryobacteraceae bacterium]|nr:3-dehydroquinate synthase [Bryobacteraceae bacterium]
MPAYEVVTGSRSYRCVVERGVLRRLHEFLPPRAGKVFIATTQDVWSLYRDRVTIEATTLLFPGGEANKRFQHVVALAEEMVLAGADRTSLIIAIGGGIVNDMGGFLASIFMRGIPVIQIPTTLLAQVDAAVGGKTGVNLNSGKNLLGAFHQPLAVLIDPEVLQTLPEREYRAGLFEVIKHGVIASPELFDLMDTQREAILAQEPVSVDRIVSESVRIKAEVVSADERENDLRRMLNFGHTIGHALEAETNYTRFLHGEAVAFGMKAATHLARLTNLLAPGESDRILAQVAAYGPIPTLDGIDPTALVRRTGSDKKTIQGRVHFVLPDCIGHVVVRTGIPEDTVLAAVNAALAEA